jgi:hypothetical protein
MAGLLSHQHAEQHTVGGSNTAPHACRTRLGQLARHLAVLRPCFRAVKDAPRVLSAHVGQVALCRIKGRLHLSTAPSSVGQRGGQLLLASLPASVRLARRLLQPATAEIARVQAGAVAAAPRAVWKMALPSPTSKRPAMSKFRTHA